MRLIRRTLRFWMTFSAGFSFVVGWALLAHAPKPVQSAAGATAHLGPVPTLAPLPPLDLSGASNGGNFQAFRGAGPGQFQPSFSSPPTFMTGGS